VDIYPCPPRLLVTSPKADNVIAQCTKDKILAKEPYILAKEPYILAKEPYVCASEDRRQTMQ